MFMNPLELHFKYDLSYHVNATLEITKIVNKKLTYYTWFARGMLSLFVIAFLFGFANFDNFKEEPLKIIGPALLAFLSFSPYMMKRKLIKQFKEHPLADSPVEVILDDNTVTINMFESNSKTGWGKFYKFNEKKLGFLFFFQSNQAFWLPFKEFKNDEDIEAVRRKIKSTN